MTIIEALEGPFQEWFDGPSWDHWKTYLRALFALPPEPGDMERFTEHTGRTRWPLQPYKEAWNICGRRAGKSIVTSALAVWLGCLQDHSFYLTRGEVGSVSIIAASLAQSRAIFSYVDSLIDGTYLRDYVNRTTQSIIELKLEGEAGPYTVRIECQPANFKLSGRSQSCIAVLLEEVAFFTGTDPRSAQPAEEIVRSVRPSLLTIPHSMLIGISSPFARKSVLFEQWSTHFAKNESTRTLVWVGSTLSMNNTIDPAEIQAACTADPAAAVSEYNVDAEIKGARWREDVSEFISLDLLNALIIPNRTKLPRIDGVNYHAFLDCSAGMTAGGDHMTLAVAHEHSYGRARQTKFILDCLVGAAPPLNVEAVVASFASVLREYKCSEVTADRFGGAFVTQLLARYGVTCNPSDRSKSDIYTECLPLLTSQRVELLDIPVLKTELTQLEKRVTRGSGKAIIDHPELRNSHDDYANVACGSLALAAGLGVKEPADPWGGVF